MPYDYFCPTGFLFCFSIESQNYRQPGAVHPQSAQLHLLVSRGSVINYSQRGGISVWARAHQGWLLPQWRNVLFSDEFRFGLVSDDYRERVWRERGGQNRLATAIGVAPYRGRTQM
nr:unnamed protein product [Callosobruchus chinensis]